MWKTWFPCLFVLQHIVHKYEWLRLGEDIILHSQFVVCNPGGEILMRWKYFPRMFVCCWCSTQQVMRTTRFVSGFLCRFQLFWHFHDVLLQSRDELFCMSLWCVLLSRLMKFSIVGLRIKQGRWWWVVNVASTIALSFFSPVLAGLQQCAVEFEPSYQRFALSLAEWFNAAVGSELWVPLHFKLPDSRTFNGDRRRAECSPSRRCCSLGATSLPASSR